MNSPFQYGKLATGTTFVNRLVEKQNLKSNLTSGINTVLIAPRRWGKSSLLKETFSEMIKEYPDVRVCYLDLFSVRSGVEFYQLYAREVLKAAIAGPDLLSSAVKEFLHEISPRISVGSDPMNDFSIDLEVADIKGNERYILDLPEKIANKSGLRVIVCVDEFQNLSRLKEYCELQTNMHGAWKKHQKVTYCLTGCRRLIMGEIFNEPENPFYNFGQILWLPKISENDWVQYIIDSFKRTGKSISKIMAILLVQKVNSHASYVIQYAHFTWILTSNNTSENILTEAFNQLINTHSSLFKRECEAMTATQLNLLVAIANDEKAFTSSAVMHKYGLGTPQNVSKNKVLLQRRDLVDLTNQGFLFLDPVFQYWFMTEYLQK